MKFLIIQQKMIGDVLTSSILCELIKKNLPDSDIHYVVNHNTVAVVENNPYIDRLIIVDKEAATNFWALVKFAKRLRSNNYDVIIDVYKKISSLIIAQLSGAKTKISFKKLYSGLVFNHSIKRISKSQHDFSLAIENRVRLLKPLGIKFEKILPKIYLTREELSEAKNFLISNGIDFEKKLFMISVLGSSKDKTYPLNYMATLLDTVVAEDKNCQILFNYIPSQLEEAREIYKLTTPETQKHILWEVYAKDLRSFLAVTSHCDAMIGNEGGANNMAKALDKPTFTIFSPRIKKLDWYGEYEEDEHVAVHIADYIEHSEEDFKKAKNNPQPYYRALKPEYIRTKLITFLGNLD